MGSGAIYALIIGLWIVVLLPIWARRNDQLNAGRQVDRFNRAMASLSTPRRVPVEHSIAVKNAPLAGRAVAKPLSAAARRRRVLGALGALQALALIALPFGLGSWAFVPTALIAAFLVLARTQVRIERERRGQQAPAAPRAQAPQTAAPSRTPRAARAGGLGRALATARASAANRVRPVEQAPAAPVVEQAPAAWLPVQTPVPSYVNAPAATAVPRAIDADGGWTGAAMVQAARAMAEAPVVGTAPDAAASRAHDFEAPDVDTTTEIPVIRITA